MKNKSGEVLTICSTYVQVEVTAAKKKSLDYSSKTKEGQEKEDVEDVEGGGAR